MLDYSIVIPVFNKAGFTKRCLETLQPTLEGAGDGEVIVIDNASTDETPDVLRAFPWARVVRNERNAGFAGANNQGAALARGRFLVLLNNDTQAFPGWLAHMLATVREPGVGAVGARLLFPEMTVQHAGVVVAPVFFSKIPFYAFHLNYKRPANDPRVTVRRDVAAVTGACLVTPRELYLKLGGLDEIFWNGYEDVDYCFKVRREGLRVVYDGAATVYHFESQSGAQRFRRTLWNSSVLLARWGGAIADDAVLQDVMQGDVRHPVRVSRSGYEMVSCTIPPVIAVIHGVGPGEDLSALEARVRSTTSVRIDRMLFAGGVDEIDAAQEALRIRGFRYAVFVDARTELREGWLEELIRQIETSPTCGCATYSPALSIAENQRALAADARCTLLSLEKFPAHVRLRDCDTWDGIVADFTLQGLGLGVGTRGAARIIAAVPPLAADGAFERAHALGLDELHCDEPVERLATVAARPRGLTSIVTLSWNAPGYTKIALESIRAHTSEPYEVIVVDNGSGEETLAMLREIDDPHIRIIYNRTNRGFAGGNNDGIAVARGEFVVLLNNDVVVTDGWIDALLRPFDHIPRLGISAPRSNRVVGHQVVYDAIYEDEEGLHRFAAERSKRFRGRGYVTDRAIGFCLCIDRRVLDEIGGLDESFGAGNFEDDDFCIRVRSAGYQIYVCDDVFIHHFGSQSFTANKVDYAATMHANWSIFAAKWGYPPAYPKNGYQAQEAIRRGFDRARHFVPIVRESEASAPVLFWAPVENERDWESVAPFVRRFLRAFTAGDAVELHLTLGADADAEAIARRIERAAAKLGLSADAIPEVVLADDEPALSARIALRDVADASPSALRRMAGAVAP